MKGQLQNSRKLAERIVVTGRLVLETPTHLGSGDSDGLLDMPLLRDELEGKALLTGATVAGALRSYLEKQKGQAAAARLFGEVTGTESDESLLIVADALGDLPEVELRDGVAINPKTRTAEDKKKYDTELLAAGASFPLHFELLVPAGQDRLAPALAQALTGLERGEIGLGKRKRRGFGKCRVTSWQVCRYRMDAPAGLIAWLEDDRSGAKSGPQIGVLLGHPVAESLPEGWCSLEATLALDGSLLIRSAGEALFQPGQELSEKAHLPDVIHLTSKRGGKHVPVLSGTSLAGALRSETIRLANTLGKDGYGWADRLFGLRPMDNQRGQKLTASRLWVAEAPVEQPAQAGGPAGLVQNRVKIDRFTGGAARSALFAEQPLFSQKGTQVKLNLRLENATPAEVGCLLLLLKSLWLGDTTLGGERSVGRGRLRGQSAVLRYAGHTWQLEGDGERSVRVTPQGAAAELQKFVDDFLEAETQPVGEGQHA